MNTINQNLQCTFTNCKYNGNKNDVLNHIFLEHSYSANFSVRCLHQNCKKNYYNYRLFVTHMKKSHNNFEDERNIRTLKCNFQDCKVYLADIHELYTHYYQHLNDSKEQQTTTNNSCFYKDCNYLISSKEKFQKHLSKYHKKEESKLKKELLVNDDEDEEFTYDTFTNDMLIDETNDMLINETNDILIDQKNEMDFQEKAINNEKHVEKLTYNFKRMQRFYMMLYLKLKDKFLIAKYKCDEIFENINSIIKINNESLNDLIDLSQQNFNQNSHATLKILKEKLMNEQTIFQEVHSKNRFESSKNDFLKQCGYYVPPREIKLSNLDSYQYIPIQQTLKAMMRHPQLNKFLRKKNENKEKINITSFNDCINFQNNNLFRKEQNAFQIILYIDDFETNNPLGDKRKEDKITACYFKLGNFGNCYQSTNSITQTIIIAEAKLIKQYGYKRIFFPLLEDLKILETNGVQITFKDEIVTLKGAISYLVADNLAANSIAGFVENFNYKLSYCRFCFATPDQIQNSGIQDESVLRTKESQLRDMKNLEKSKKVHINGVKGDCCFNVLENFDSTSNFPPDIMHDLLEGAIRQNFKILINYLTTKKTYSVEQLNYDLKLFEYGNNDVANRVPDSLFSDASSFKMSATHMWMLSRVFPLIAGRKLKDNEQYKNFLQIVEIFRLLNGESFDEETINELTEKIENYIKNFKKVYPNEKISPKMHFLIHYPDSIRKFGPPKLYSTIRFEAKHSYFKQVDKSTHNHINLPYSLAIRHQHYQVYHLLEDNYFLDLEYGTQDHLEYNLLKLVEISIKKIKTILRWIMKRGIKYNRNDLIVTSKTQNLPNFSLIKSIIIDENDLIYFLIENLKTIEYVDNLASYKLIETESMCKIIKQSELISNWPLDLYKIENELFVSLKYPI